MAGLDRTHLYFDFKPSTDVPPHLHNILEHFRTETHVPKGLETDPKTVAGYVCQHDYATDVFLQSGAAPLVRKVCGSGVEDLARRT